MIEKLNPSIPSKWRLTPTNVCCIFMQSNGIIESILLLEEQSPSTLVWQLYKNRNVQLEKYDTSKTFNDQRENNYLLSSMNPLIMLATSLLRMACNLCPVSLIVILQATFSITVVWICSEITVLVLALPHPPPCTPPLTCPLLSGCFHPFLTSTSSSAAAFALWTGLCWFHHIISNKFEQFWVVVC